MEKKTVPFIIAGLMLCILFFVSINLGSLKVSYGQLIHGLFAAYDETVSIIYDLRFPRIVIAVLSGAALAVSGAQFQAVLKNPLADPGIIGISSAASFVSVIVIAFFPKMYFFTPLFAFIGGIIACLLVYILSWQGGFSPLRIVLTGIGINYFFIGLAQCFGAVTGQRYSSAAAVVNAGISMKTWADVRLLAVYVLIGLICSFFTAKSCNLLALEDNTIRSLGINVTAIRGLVSLNAVLLASITTAVAGNIIFMGLIVPHIGRMIVGSDYKRLLPFSVLLGAFVMLGADTIGRLIAYPYEIPAAVIMSVLGGPFFIILLKRSNYAG